MSSFANLKDSIIHFSDNLSVQRPRFAQWVLRNSPLQVSVICICTRNKRVKLTKEYHQHHCQNPQESYQVKSPQELRFDRFVPKITDCNDCSDSSTCETQHQKCLFTNPSFSMFGFSFVDTSNNKGQQIDKQQIQERKLS